MIKVRRFVLWGSLGVAAWALIAGEHGLIRYRLLKNTQANYRLETRKLTARMMDLEQEIWRLQNDTLYIEKMARERLGFARPNERVYKITEY